MLWFRPWIRIQMLSAYGSGFGLIENRNRDTDSGFRVRKKWNRNTSSSHCTLNEWHDQSSISPAAGSTGGSAAAAAAAAATGPIWIMGGAMAAAAAGLAAAAAAAPAGTAFCPAAPFCPGAQFRKSQMSMVSSCELEWNLHYHLCSRFYLNLTADGQCMTWDTPTISCQITVKTRALIIISQIPPRHPFPKACLQHSQTVIQPCMWFMEEPSQFSAGQTAQSLTCSIMGNLLDCLRMLLSWFRKWISDPACEVSDFVH